MIHDEGIEKAIVWLESLEMIVDDNRQAKQATISGLRELQIARQTIAEKDALIEKLVERGNLLCLSLRACLNHVSIGTWAKRPFQKAADAWDNLTNEIANEKP